MDAISPAAAALASSLDFLQGTFEKIHLQGLLCQRLLQAMDLFAVSRCVRVGPRRFLSWLNLQKCWHGASVGHRAWKPQRAVFVADDDQAIWIVDNFEAVRNFPAAHVVLAGKFDSAKKTIHVGRIAPAASDHARV